jgi:hypothetical protein
MRVLWKAAAEAWEAAGYRIGQANLLIRQLEANRDPLAAPPAVTGQRSRRLSAPSAK